MTDTCERDGGIRLVLRGAAGLESDCPPRIEASTLPLRDVPEPRGHVILDRQERMIEALRGAGGSVRPDIASH